VAVEGISKCYAETEAPTVAGAEIESPKSSSRRGVWGGVPLHLTRGEVLGECRKLYQRGPRRSPTENGFYAYFRSEEAVWDTFFQ